MSKKLFVQVADKTFMTDGSDVPGVDRSLPYGCYTLKKDYMKGSLIFNKLDIAQDNFVELPSPEVEKTLHEIKTFITPESKALFDKEGICYKHSFFFHGNPGTGKTYLINKIVDLLKDKAICIYSRNPSEIMEASKLFSASQENDVVVYIMEEIDEMIENGYEIELLQLLDSGLQRKNTIFVATSNNFHLVPKRIIRPGRFTSVIKVNEPGVAARRAYLLHRWKDNVAVDDWVEGTKGFTIDEIKSAVDQVMFYGYSVKSALKAVKETRE